MMRVERLTRRAPAVVRGVFDLVRPHLGPLAVAFSLSAIYFILDLRGGDLAAHLYRAELFKNDGFFVWNYNWYGGHYVVSYGIMFPTLAATVGVRLAGAFAYIAGTLLFSILAREVFSRRGATASSFVFATVFSATLMIGQLPYALSVAIGLGALLAAAHARPWVGLFLAVNCALTSPLAALFIAFVAFTVWFGAWLPRRGELRATPLAHANVFAPIAQRPFLVVAVGTLLPAVIASVLFPEGGSQPFNVASYLGSIAFTAFFWYFVRDDLTADIRRMVGAGVLLYAAFLTINELIPSPVGGNAIRLGMLLFPTVAAAALWPRAGRFALAVVLPLLCWQGATAAWAIATRDATADPRFFAPVNAFLDKQDPTHEQKVEVVFTRNHFEAAYVANRRPIARGWERQLDTKYNAVFYEGDLTVASYAAWLVQNDVRWVALADAPIDYSARQEAALIRAGLPYLKRVAQPRNWNVYRVKLPDGGGIEPRFFDQQPDRGFQIQPVRYGVSVTRVRWQRFLRPSVGCIEASDSGYLQIMLPPVSPGDVSSHPPVVTITSDFSIGRLVGAEPSCADGWTLDDNGQVRHDTGATARIGGRV
jgi:hypothetical protein